jgi:hypothetical protein
VVLGKARDRSALTCALSLSKGCSSPQTYPQQGDELHGCH